MVLKTDTPSTAAAPPLKEVRPPVMAVYASRNHPHFVFLFE
jgi:hypothetical protein